MVGCDSARSLIMGKTVALAEKVLRGVVCTRVMFTDKSTDPFVSAVARVHNSSEVVVERTGWHNHKRTSACRTHTTTHTHTRTFALPPYARTHARTHTRTHAPRARTVIQRTIPFHSTYASSLLVVVYVR